jgi:hypothetical protein
LPQPQLRSLHWKPLPRAAPTAGLRASVAYGDLTGTVAADQHGTSGLADLGAAAGIDSDRYFIFGAALGLSVRPAAGRPPYVTVDLLAVDREATGCMGIDSLRDYLDFNGGVLPYLRLPLEVTLDEFLSCFKRLDLVLHNRGLDGAVSRYDELDDEWADADEDSAG